MFLIIQRFSAVSTHI